MKKEIEKFGEMSLEIAESARKLCSVLLDKDPVREKNKICKMIDGINKLGHVEDLLDMVNIGELNNEVKRALMDLHHLSNMIKIRSVDEHEIEAQIKFIKWKLYNSIRTYKYRDFETNENQIELFGKEDDEGLSKMPEESVAQEI